MHRKGMYSESLGCLQVAERRLDFDMFVPLCLKGFLQTGLKPDNMMIGAGKNKNKVYIMDFGRSRKYRDENGNHYQYR